MEILQLRVGKQLISTNTYSQAPIGMLTIQGPTTGSTALTASQFGIVIGPQHTRSSTANTYYPGIVFNHLLNHTGQSTYNNAPQAYIGTRLHDTSGSERDFLVFATKSGTGTAASDVPVERMCIDPVYGSVGIGTTDPDSQMQIGRFQTTDAFNGAFIKLRPSSTTNSTGLTSITLGTSTVDNYGYSISGWRAGTDGSPYLRIQRHYNSATGTDVMVMNNSGDVGIGTTSPAQKLHVNGGSDANLRLTSASTRSGIFIDKPGTTTIMGSALVLADETYRLGTASYYHVNMTQGGVTALLYQGSTKIATTSGGVTVTGTLTETSSIAIKENVETYTPSLDIINKIRPVKYNRKENKKKKEIGLIAEELAELFPELVEKDEKGNPSSVNYSRAVTVLLGGFKELYKEVQELKKRI